jgi:hypothetical protein
LAVGAYQIPCVQSTSLGDARYVACLDNLEGTVASVHPAQVGGLQLIWQCETTPYPPPLLSQAEAQIA